MKCVKNICLVLVSLFFLSACSNSEKVSKVEAKAEEVIELAFDISLAQWSLHKSFFGGRPDWGTFGRLLQENPDSLYQGEIHPDDFPAIAATYGVDVIELVNTFYFGKAGNMEYWKSFKAKCEAAGVKVGLIMCDALGDLGDADEEARNEAVENHHDWVDAAAFLGAHTIRVNAAGEGSAEEVAENAVKGLKKLGEYGAAKGINVVVENHGGYSSNGAWLAGVMKEVGMDNVGTLPDLGNFCIKRGKEYECEEEYDMYLGTEELMPFAKGVSAKTHNFDAEGNESDIDYARMMKIVKESGFKGTIGIEYEGSELTEEEGIKKTIALLKKYI